MLSLPRAKRPPRKLLTVTASWSTLSLFLLPALLVCLASSPAAASSQRLNAGELLWVSLAELSAFGSIVDGSSFTVGSPDVSVIVEDEGPSLDLPVREDGELPAPGEQAFPAHAQSLFGRVIASVELRLPRGVDPEEIRPLVALRAGSRLERGDVRHAVRLLYETGLFRQVRVHAREKEEKAAVTLVLLPRRRVAEVSFLGAEVLDRGRLTRAAGVMRGDDLSMQAMERVTEGVERAYARRGYRDAVVRKELRESEDGEVALLVRIREGRPTRLAGVRWEGETGLPEEVLHDVLGLSTGDLLDLDVVEDALDVVRERYVAAGHLLARVGSHRIEPVASENGDDEAGGQLGVGDDQAEKAREDPRAFLVLHVSAGPLIRMRVLGNERLGDEHLKALVRREYEGLIEVGVQSRAARRIERAYRLTGHLHAKVAVEEEVVSSLLRQVVVRVIEGPPTRVRSIEFPGANGLSERWMRRQVCSALEEAVLSESRALDRDVMRSLGGRGSYRQSSEPKGAGVLQPKPCEVFEPEAYSKAVEVIIDRYRREGWLNARMEEPELSLSPDRRVAKVAIEVEEGTQSYLHEVGLNGVEELNEAEVLSAAGLVVGRPLSTTDVEDGRLAIRRLYAASGHPFASVETETTFEEKGTEARVEFEVNEGPRVAVGRVIVRGHYYTPASLVRSQLTFGSGDVWDLKSVQSSQRRILSLGIYRSASIRLLDPDEPASVMDVVVTVAERRPKAVEMGIGLSTEDGPRLFAEYADHAFVRSSELRARAKINYPIFPSGLELRRVLAPGMEWEAQAGLRFPSLLSARTDVVGERANRPTFGLTRAAWSVGADSRWRHEVTASMGLEMEYVDFERAAPDPDLFHPEHELRRFEEGRTLLVSLRPGLVLDLRDRPVSPRRGVLAGAAIDWSHDLGVGVPVHFLKTTANVSGYVPASRTVTFAVSVRGGMVVPLSEDNVTIEPKRFFLGGADTLRGFPLDGVVPEDQRVSLREQVDACRGLISPGSCTEDALMVIADDRRPASYGGEAFVLLKGELRFPITGELQGGLFVDTGNLWRDGSNVDLLTLRTSAGGGLRYETPVGPVAVDLGVNLVRDEVLNEMPMAVHFAIGLF